MSITIHFPPELEQQLRARAAARGGDVNTLVIEAVEEKLRAEPLQALTEILAPFRREVDESGLSDGELETLFKEALEEVRAQKKTQSGSVS